MESRQLSVSSTFGEVFSLYFSQGGVLFLLAFAFFFLVGVLELVVKGDVGLVAVGFVAGTVATMLYQGVVAAFVRDLRQRDDAFSVAGLLRSVLPVAVPLIAAGFLLFLGLILGFVMLVVPGLILMTLWAVVVPVIVVERVGVIRAFGRSQELVSGSGWAVFAVIAFAVVVAFLATAVALLVVGSEGTLEFVLVNLVALTVATPLTALAPAVLYFRLREIEAQQAPAPS
jgi:hypothetical protein